MAAWVASDAALRRLALPDEPPVSLVGGAVRDAALGVRHGPDVDLVVEGDAVALARALGRRLGARVVTHERFGTAAIELELPHGRVIDLVSARRERYAAPGALPEVSPGTIADDLARRDFTINAMAFRLSGPAAGDLLDPHGGRADLRARLVRTLRPDAFTEDPSRLLRAVRYAARLGFALEPATREQAAAAAGAVDLASPRVADELRRVLGEERPADALVLARDLGVGWLDGARLDALDGRLRALDEALARPGAPDLPLWPLRLGVALGPAAADVAVAGWARALAAEAVTGVGLARRIAACGGRPSAVDGILATAPPAAAAAALAAGAHDVARWWAEWRDRRPELRGADLVAAGMAPGPAVGRALRAVRAAVLDGEVGGREDQLALALRAAAV